MAKKKSRKRPARREKGRAGCMWGLINLFDFRQGRFTQKMISDGKRESGRLSVGDGYSRSRYNLQTEFQENHKVPDTGCTDKSNGGKIDRGKNDIRRSVRVLMEEEMSEMQRPNRISRTKSKETRSDSGRGRYTEKNLMQENKTYKVAGSHASGSLETDDTHYADIMEVYSRNLNSNKELLLKHLHEQKLILVKHVHDVQSGQAEEMASIELPKILERRKVVDDVIISKQCESLVGSQQLHKHGMSNFFRKKEKIQSNKSLKDSDQGVDHIVLLKPSSSNVQNPKSVINLSTSPHCQNSFRNQGESERTSFHFSLREMKRRLKQAIGDDKKERRWISRDGVLHRIPQGFQGLGDNVERIVVDDVKENLCHKTTDNSQRRSETSAGPQRRENKGKSNGFQFNIGSEVTSSRAYRIQKEAKKRLADLLSIEDGDMDLQSRQVHKPLGRILSLPDYNLLSPRFSPGRDPWFSPGRDIRCSPMREKEPIFVPQPIKFSSLQKAKQEVTASPLIWSMENLESSSVTNEESGIEPQVPNLIPGLSEGDHDMNSQKGLCIKDDKNPEGDAGTSESSGPECMEDDNDLHDNFEENSNGPSIGFVHCADIIDQQETYEEVLIPRLESCEEAPQLMYARIPVSPSLLFQTVDGSESSDEKVERPSPVSVLDPFSTEEIHSPERSTAQRDFSIQPRRIQFEETDNTSIVVTTLDFETNSRSCIADEESRLDYVRNILETSGLGCGNLSESKWHSAEQVLDPSLFDEVETSSGEFSDDLKLLFDCINEALLEIHERYFGPSPWVSFIKPKARSCLKGDDLVQVVMEGIDWYNPFQYPGTLEQIVGKDLTKGETWMDLRLHVEFVGFDMEEAILEDLMEETILELWD